MSHNTESTLNWKLSLSFLILSLTLPALVVQPVIGAGPEAATPDSPVAASSAFRNAPFAKVYLALKGCTSCAACRSKIRQMTKGAAEDGKVSMPGDGVEVRYTEPTTIPLKKVVGNLAKNRLHDLKLVDVLFDASGQIHADSSGSLLFIIQTTGQQYTISVPDGANTPPNDKSLRLSAVVRGWRAASSELSLELKSFAVIDRKSDS